MSNTVYQLSLLGASLVACASPASCPTEAVAPLPPVASVAATPSARPHPSAALPQLVSAPPPPLAAIPEETPEEQALVAIVIAGNGDVVVRGKLLTNDEAIVAFAKEARAKDPNVRARIDADARVTYGRVVQVMDALMRGGVQRIAFGVSPRAAP